ncbi:MAG: DUF58 domain-containing protein [Anaerolineae bacterium]
MRDALDRRGVFLASVAVLAGWMLQRPAITLLGTVVLFVAFLVWLWSRYALVRIEHGRRFEIGRVFAGEETVLEIEVTNRKILPLAWLRIEDRAPLKVTPREQALAPSPMPGKGLLVHLLSMRWYERVRWRYTLDCPHRGIFQFGPARLTSGDVFGLRETAQELPRTTPLIVYPQVHPLDRLGLPTKEPFGDFSAEQWIYEDLSRPAGVREYRVGDPLKRIHWKATARTARLQSRAFEPTTAPHLSLFLDVATFTRHWEGLNPALLERTVVVAASVANFAAEAGYGVGLLANCSWPMSDRPVSVAPGRAPTQMRRVLEALAAVSSLPSHPIDRLLSVEAGRIFWGATLVVVTPVVATGLIEEMAGLRRRGRRMCLITLDPNPVEGDLEGITVHSVAEEAVGEAMAEGGVGWANSL